MDVTKKAGRGYLLIGTYTCQGEGIYVYACDYDNATFDYRATARVEDPSYIALDSRRRHVYALRESSAPSEVNAFGFDPQTGEIGPAGSSTSSEEGMCNIVVSPDDRFVLTANYSSGSVSVFPVLTDGRTGGELQAIRFHGSGPDHERQEASHIHCVRFCPCGRHIFVTDLGGDAIYRFDVNTSHPGDGSPYVLEDTLKVFPMQKGSGPRHFVFDPEGRFVYLVNEMAVSVTVLSYDKGELAPIQNISCLPDEELLPGGRPPVSLDRRGKPCSPFNTDDEEPAPAVTPLGGDIKISHDGRYVYASVRDKNDGIAVFERDRDTGTLTFVHYQPCVSHPRNIEFTPCGRYLFVAGMNARTVQIFIYNPYDGSLKDLERIIDVPNPSCLVFTAEPG